MANIAVQKVNSTEARPQRRGCADARTHQRHHAPSPMAKVPTRPIICPSAPTLTVELAGFKTFTRPDGGFDQRSYTHSLLGVLNWTRGTHSLRFGFDGRLTYDSSTTFGDVYTRGPLDNSPASVGVGQNFASLLYGIPTGGGIDIHDSCAEASPPRSERSQ